MTRNIGQLERRGYSRNGWARRNLANKACSKQKKHAYLRNAIIKDVWDEDVAQNAIECHCSPDGDCSYTEMNFQLMFTCIFIAPKTKKLQDYLKKKYNKNKQIEKIKEKKLF
jgi:hypothetical protein